LDLATRYQEIGDALLPLINPVVGAKYGLTIESFILENASVPPEVEAAIDKRSSMSAIGNLNDYVKYQMAEGMPKGGSPGGAPPAPPPTGAPHPPPPAGAAPPEGAAAGIPELMNPADVAKVLGVTEAD